MISKHKFQELREQIDQAVDELLTHARKRSQGNDFIVFLAKSDYLPENEGTNHSPWISAYELESIQENDITQFLMDYLNSKYKGNIENTEDSKYDLIIELMLYTHMWESTRHIKLLRRLAILCSGQLYQPYIDINSDTRYTFIKEQIRDIFQNEGLKIYDLIKGCYKSQFRNAFAHNDFSLSDNAIIFNNYNPPNHPFQTLAIDEWTKIFLLSALIKMTVSNKVHSYANEFSHNESFDVTLRHGGEEYNALLHYDSERQQFFGKIK